MGAACDKECDYEYRALEAERDQLRAELERVKAERDALKAGKWAGPWVEVSPDYWMRQDTGQGEVCAAFRSSWRVVALGHLDTVRGTAKDTEANRAAADAALRAAGWWLAESDKEPSK